MGTTRLHSRSNPNYNHVPTMIMKKVIFLTTLILIVISTHITTNASTTIRIEYENDTASQIRMMWVIPDTNYFGFVYMTRQGNLWTYNLQTQRLPLRIGFINQYNSLDGPHYVYGNSRVSNGQVTPITPITTTPDLDGLYTRLYELYNLIYQLAENSLTISLWQLSMLSFSTGITLILIIAIVWGRSS